MRLSRYRKTNVSRWRRSFNIKTKKQCTGFFAVHHEGRTWAFKNVMCANNIRGKRALYIPGTNIVAFGSTLEEIYNDLKVKVSTAWDRYVNTERYLYYDERQIQQQLLDNIDLLDYDTPACIYNHHLFDELWDELDPPCELPLRYCPPGFKEGDVLRSDGEGGGEICTDKTSVRE